MDEMCPTIQIKVQILTSIGRSLRNKLQLSVERVISQNNGSNVYCPNRERLNFNWQRVPNDRYRYISSIGHQLEYRDLLDRSFQLDNSVTVIPSTERLEIRSRWDNTNYLYWQLTPKAIDSWLRSLLISTNLWMPDSVKDRPPSHISPATILYARARCYSFLNLARSVGTIGDEFGARIYLNRVEHRDLQLLIFTHPVELDLIAACMDAVDMLDGVHRGKFDRAIVNLAVSWLEFYRYCQVIGVDRDLAIARAGLTAIVVKILDLALIVYWGIDAPTEI
jgi:hypothetical protein